MCVCLCVCLSDLRVACALVAFIHAMKSISGLALGVGGRRREHAALGHVGLQVIFRSHCVCVRLGDSCTRRGVWLGLVRCAVWWVVRVV